MKHQTEHVRQKAEFSEYFWAWEITPGVLLGMGKLHRFRFSLARDAWCRASHLRKPYEVAQALGKYRSDRPTIVDHREE